MRAEFRIPETRRSLSDGFRLELGRKQNGGPSGSYRYQIPRDADRLLLDYRTDQFLANVATMTRSICRRREGRGHDFVDLRDAAKDTEMPATPTNPLQ